MVQPAIAGGRAAALLSGRIKAGATPAAVDPESMNWIPGGAFLMGSNSFYREERPVRPASVEGFWMDIHPVTNGEFRRFVEATGYVTYSERPPNPAMYPDADPALLVPGSLVFVKPRSSGQPAQQPRLVGISTPAPTGGIRKGPAVRSPAATIIPSCTSPMRTRAPMRRGAARNCRPKPNGNSPPAAVSKARPIRGATPPIRKGRFLANTWQGRFPARESRRGRIRGHFAGRCVSPQWLRPVRHGRQRLGMDVEPL